MTGVFAYASMICVAAGLICGTLALMVSRRFLVGLRVALDFWLAAGLLRLVEPATLTSLLGTALIIAIRQAVSAALRSSKPGPSSTYARGPRQP
jgi:hypothetical protein